MSNPAPEFKGDGVPPTRWNRDFEKKSEELKPDLHRWTRTIQNIISFDKDEGSYFGVRASRAVGSIEQFESKTWGKGDGFVVDFGIHMVGFLSMKLDAHGSQMDAPCRLRLTFGETPLDVTRGMDNVKTWISTAWLPDEIINIDMCPEVIRLPRRYSFRFLRVEVIDTSIMFKVSFSDVACECVSAVSQDDEIELPHFKEDLIGRIDQVCVMTLRDCMQTVFEDGPRRDRRLWIGDLRLQALANYKTFRNFGLVKRCIYQFAAIAREDGAIPACLFESPKLKPSSDYIVDYDALFAVIVRDYVEASGDLEAGKELWPSVLGCLKKALSNVEPGSGVFDVTRSKDWKFLDWQPELDRNAGLHGVLIYCLRAANGLARLIGRDAPYEQDVANLTRSAAVFLSDAGLFVSGPEQQVSYASAAWLTLSGAFPEKTAREALLKSLETPDAVRPLTPYMWHYVCDALSSVGCADKCLEIITDYWGRMVEAGADTFWEYFDPEDCMGSPYGDARNNSYCHAWSCTPTYLLRGKLSEKVVRENSCSSTVTIRQLDDAWVTRSGRRYSLKDD
ncbi:Bacterial alpha-L-rhamnosidase [Geosmithia morbida]|uniref:Bacterial alpha-L-rhamnosidase n=1 Tax=Geosmithia morbida TaxID=1094350 RepID=A0A9P4YS48_9HYPO|nr:Bacterial alpha-L-rhamnosidase [Geosmithia morbida]KAF4120832.1 Bacterial alpha-L-rhamnosidase [Geosmithia morbida]